MRDFVRLGEKSICPICGKEFEITEDTKYIAGGDCTCSWKCFQKEVKAHEKESKEKFEQRRAKRNKRENS